MNLRRIFLLAITLIPLILSSGVLVYRQYVLLPSYLAAEDQLLTREMSIIEGYIEHDRQSIDFVTWDWASWDDTYDYMQSLNPAFISSNMVTGTFTDGGINIMLLQNNATETIYGRHVDMETGKDLQIPVEILEFPEFNASGVIKAGDDIFLISSRYILTSNDTGPARGRLIMAKLVDEDFITELAELAQLPLWMDGSTDSEIIIDRYSNSELSVEFPVYDVFDAVAFRVGFTFNRALYQNGYQNTLTLLLFIGLFSLLVGVVSIYIADTLLLKRISNLSSNLDDISQSHNLSKRIEQQTPDEIGVLIENINNMLESLEDSSNLEIRHKEELLRIRERYAVNLVEGTKEIAETLNNNIEKPLQALKNANYLLEKAYPEEKELQTLYHAATKTIEKVLNEINYTIPQDEVVFRPFDINETLDKVLGRRTIEEYRYIRLYENKFNVINGDQNLIHTGIMLLLDRIESRCEPETKISIDVSENNGIDIIVHTSEKCDDVYQIDNNESTDEPNFELMYLREVLHSHGGSITYDDADGSTFTIHLPGN